MSFVIVSSKVFVRLLESSVDTLKDSSDSSQELDDVVERRAVASNEPHGLMMPRRGAQAIQSGLVAGGY
jgi:hypothetical protein